MRRPRTVLQPVTIDSRWRSMPGHLDANSDGERVYAKAPVVVAAAEFTFGPSATSRGSLAEVVDGLGLGLSSPQALRRIEVNFEISSTIQQHRLVSHEMTRFETDDKTVTVDIGPRHLAITHHPPYPGWHAFFPIIQRCVANYRELLAPESLVSMSLRYVNQIPIPADTPHLETLFEFRPCVGERLPDYVGFVMATHSLFADGRDALRIQMSSDPMTSHAKPKVTLDLHYLLNIPSAVLFDGADNWLDEAHLRISQAFEGCIKPQLRAQFKEE